MEVGRVGVGAFDVLQVQCTYISLIGFPKMAFKDPFTIC